MLSVRLVGNNDWCACVASVLKRTRLCRDDLLYTAPEVFIWLRFPVRSLLSTILNVIMRYCTELRG